MNMEERLARLERSHTALRRRHARLRALTAAVVLVNVFAFTLGATPNQIPDVIRAKRFEVIGGTEDPQVSALMGATDDGAGVVQVFNESGRTAFEARVSAAGPGEFKTYTADGFPLVYVGAFSDGSGQVTVENGKGRSLVVFGSDSRGAGRVQTFNGDGHLLAGLEASPHGSGEVHAYDGEGWGVVALGTTPAGLGLIKAFGREGTPAVTIAADPEAGGQVFAFDSEQNLKARWPEPAGKPAEPAEDEEPAGSGAPAS